MYVCAFGSCWQLLPHSHQVAPSLMALLVRIFACRSSRLDSTSAATSRLRADTDVLVTHVGRRWASASSREQAQVSWTTP
jgi:hypothetical protein